MKKILFSISVLGITLAIAFGLTSAFFSDTETSTGNTFTSGAIDLLINGENDPTGIVSFDDLKPGDEYIEHKTVRVDTNDAYVWMHLKDIVSDQGAQTEPENLEESLNEIKHDTQNYLVYDLSIFRDGIEEEVLVSADNGNLLPEMSSCWIPLGIIPGGTTIDMNQSFHFDSTVTNWAQGDTLTFTEEFYAEQVRNNPNPTPPSTGSGRVWNDTTKHCEYDLTQLIETVTVAAIDSTAVTSPSSLTNGTNYVLKVMGTANAGDTIDFDAKYSLTGNVLGDTWTDPVSGYISYGNDLLNLQVNGSFVNWGAFNPAHEYYYMVTGDGNPVSLLIYDVYYPNNSGSLTVEIYELP